jgi:membrane protease subunit HflC
MNRIIALVVAVVIVLFAASSMLFVVDQRHMAVLSARGGGTPEVLGPGLHWKLPAPLQTVTLVDSRVQAVEAADVGRYTTADKTELLVEPVIQYRVTDPLKLYEQTHGDDQTLPERLVQAAGSALVDTFAKFSLADALGKQQEIAGDARSALAAAVAPLGVDVLAVQLTRIDYPSAQADSVYKRMAAAREQAASEVRAQGQAAADKIRADALAQQQSLLANASVEAQTIKGEGDGKAAAIAAQAYGRDPQFYQFYQSMEAYRNTFRPGDVIVVDSSSDFFRFMRSPNGDNSSPPAALPRKH